MFRPGLGISVAVGLLTTSVVAQGIRYVDDNAPPGGDGLTWNTALQDLQAALVTAPGDPAITDVRVAGGSYHPGSNRTDTFRLRSGLTLTGGYRGLAPGGSPDDRDWSAFQTILSGDIGTPGNASDNCYHVVTGTGTDASAVLDGFTITGGYADGPNSSPTGAGGGMFNDPGSPTVVNCTFTGNHTPYHGGGMHNANGSSPTIINCVFALNVANWGGALHNTYGSSPSIINCIFTGNTANVPGMGGGMMNNEHSHPTLINCTFSGNAGSTISNWGYSDPTLANCIIWGGTGHEITGYYFAPTVTYSNIQGGTGQAWFGAGCIDVDPQFVRDPDDGGDGWGDDPATPGVDESANDDFGDLHLSGGSPCIDSGNNSDVPLAITTDFDGDRRIVDGDGDAQETVDMGADERWSDCNNNGVSDGMDLQEGTSVDWNENGILDECEDCNENEVPDFIDVIFEWSADCNENLVPDECDIATGTSADLNADGIPDECEDCNDNDVWDLEDIAQGTSQDCNTNDIPDECDIADGFSSDWNDNDIPDECDEDCNENDVPDFVDVLYGFSDDLNGNGAPDECDIFGDFDGDADCDTDDYRRIPICLRGPGVAYPGICRTADLDGDGDCDMNDFAIFAAGFTGPPYNALGSPRRAVSPLRAL